MENNENKCGICGQPMPKGEEMFRYHGYSGPCPIAVVPVPSDNAEGAAPVTPKSETAFEDEKWEWEESTDKGYGWITRKGSRLSFSLHESVRKFVELHNAALTRAFVSVSSPAGSSTEEEEGVGDKRGAI